MVFLKTSTLMCTWQFGFRNTRLKSRDAEATKCGLHGAPWMSRGKMITEAVPPVYSSFYKSISTVNVFHKHLATNIEKMETTHVDVYWSSVSMYLHVCGCVGVCGCEWKKEAKKGWIQVFTSPIPRHTPVTNTDDKSQWLVTSHRTRMDTTQWTVVCSQQHNSRGDNFAQHRRQASFLMHRLEKEIWEWRSFFSLSHRWHAPSTGWRMAKTSGRHVTHFSAALTSRSCWSSRQHFRSHVQAAPRCGRDKSSAQEEVRVPMLG